MWVGVKGFQMVGLNHACFNKVNAIGHHFWQFNSFSANNHE